MIKPTSKISKILRRFGASERAVAAVEFAIIAPILILLFVGTIEISLAVAVDRKVSRISSSVADLITQSSKFTGDEINEIMNIADRIMFPYDDVPKISIVGIEIKNDEAKVTWACQKNGAPKPAVGSTVSVPSQIKVNDTFLVSATVTTDHEPAFKFVGYENGRLTFDDASIEMSEQMFLRPRLGGQVEVTGC